MQFIKIKQYNTKQIVITKHQTEIQCMVIWQQKKQKQQTIDNRQQTNAQFSSELFFLLLYFTVGFSAAVYISVIVYVDYSYKGL